MKRNDESNPETWEKDPVWDLLRQAPRAEARPSFVDDVVRAARLQEADEPWWKRLRMPLAFGSLATAATAVLVAFVILNNPPQPSAPGPVVLEEPAGLTEELAELDEVVRSEALLVAAEDPSAFSDAELVSLISY